MKEIPLTQGKVARVDENDFNEQGQYEWCAVKSRKTWYAVRGVGTRQTQKRIYLHRTILHAPDGVKVDHEDGDGLNCQRNNLRLASGTQNQANTGKRSDNTSGYKGVTWDAVNNKWLARVKADGRRITLGRYTDLAEAARAYDAGARKYFGEFARLNFPGGDSAALL